MELERLLHLMVEYDLTWAFGVFSDWTFRMLSYRLSIPGSCMRYRFGPKTTSLKERKRLHFVNQSSQRFYTHTDALRQLQWSSLGFVG